MKLLIIHNSQDKVRSENILKQFASQNTQHKYEIVEAVMNPSQFCAGVSRSFKKCVQIAKNGWYSEIMVLEDDFLQGPGGFHVFQHLESFVGMLLNQGKLDFRQLGRLRQYLRRDR